MVIRVLAVPDYLHLASFDEVFRALLGWEGLGFSFHIHGREFTSFLRRTKTNRTRLQDFHCVLGKPFSTPAAGWTFGNGSSGFSP
jgi:hypothetical protein